MNDKEVKYGEWNEATNNYQAGQHINVERTCFAYSATNIGDTIAEINGKRIFPSATPATVVGDSISLSDPAGKLFKGQIKLTFIAPIGAAPNVEITQLYYLDKNSY